MKFSARIIGILIFLCAIGVMAGNALSVPQDDKTRRNRQQNDDKDKNKNKTEVKEQPILEEEEEIPDSLLHPRWAVQRTVPITEDDLQQGSADLKRPENLSQQVVYNDSKIQSSDAGAVPERVDKADYHTTAGKRVTEMCRIMEDLNKRAVL